MSADFSRIMSGPLPAGQAQLTAATTAAAGCMQVCDETSPLSSDSSTVLGLQHTPMGVEVISVGCKRNYDQLASSQAVLSHQAQHQVAQQTLLFLQQRQALLQQHKSCNQLFGHVPARPHLQPVPQQQVASEVLHTVNSKVEAAKQQLQALLMQHSQHQQHRSSLEAVKAAVGSKRVVVGGAQQQLSVPFCQQQLGGAATLAWQQQQQQLAALKLQQQQPSPAQQQRELLAEQHSGFSVTSSAASFSSTTTGISTIQQHRSAPPASCNSDAVRAWQTLLMQQQRVRLQEQQQQHSLQQWQPQLAQAAAVTHVSSLTRPLLSSAGSVTSSGSGVLTTTLSLIQHQQQLQQRLQQQQQPLQQHAPPAKRPATQSAVAALLSVSAATAQAKHMQLQLKLHQLQQQQQRPAVLRQASQPQSLLKPGLIPSTTAGSADSSMLSSAALAAAVSAAAAAVAARVCLAAPDAVQNRLLSWAGQVLCCHLQDAYLLATHLYSKVCGRLDDMLLISLGITQPLDNVTMLVCLWVATKLEGHRRQVAGCSKLCAALQLPPWSVTSVELHLMQLLGWQPYSGWLRPSSDPPSCQVLEV
jgi:hypothetical protein